MLLALAPVVAAAAETVVDLPTRPGVSLRMLYATPDAADTPVRAAAVLLSGGHGALKIYPNGSIGWGERSFLVRTRGLLVQQGMAVLLLDAPTDRRAGLAGFRTTPEHAADIGAAIAWLRQRTGVPVWLIGHSRGTESAVSATLRLGDPPAGPDGLVLAASILTDSAFAAGQALPRFPLEQLHLPVLVLHHDADACSVTAPRDLPLLVDRLTQSSRSAVVRLSGGKPLGDLCGSEGTHGFGGLDGPAAQAMGTFVLGR